MRRQQGIALLVVLVILLAVGASSTAFIWFMQRQQTRSGLRYRSAAALAVAEGGVHRALAVLEGTAPEGWHRDECRRSRRRLPAPAGASGPGGRTEGGRSGGYIGKIKG